MVSLLPCGVLHPACNSFSFFFTNTRTEKIMPVDRSKLRYKGNAEEKLPVPHRLRRESQTPKRGECERTCAGRN